MTMFEKVRYGVLWVVGVLVASQVVAALTALVLVALGYELWE